MTRFILICLCLGFQPLPLASQAANPIKQFRLAYFEGGQYPVHSVIRSEFTRQLERVLPEGYEAVFVPEGYRSAGWKRDSCHIMAHELAGLASIDMVVAIGPWVVEDLLAAGFTKPILAMHQFDPVAQGLVDSTGRPVAPNLTVHVKPGRIERDLQMLSRLVKVNTLGVLYFPSGNETGQVLASIDTVVQTLGMEVVTAEGYDNYGTYAFFKAYRALEKKVDALYLPPMMGMNEVKLVEFFAMCARDGVPTFTSEPVWLVEKGAFATASALAAVSESRYNALKAVQILMGASPESLATEFLGGSALAVNEQTVQDCRIGLPTEILNEATLIPAPAPETTPVYRLSEALERAVSSNPGLLARYDALEAAVQAGKQAYSPYLPHIVGQASVEHLDDNTVANALGLPDQDQLRSTFVFHQRLFSAETIKSIQAAAKQKDLEQMNLQQVKLDLELAVTAAYINMLVAQEVLDIHRRYRAVVDRLMEITGTRQMLEDAGEIDLIRWKDERHKITSDIIQARSDLDAAAVILNVLFNLPGASPLAVDTAELSLRKFWREYEYLQTRFSTADEAGQLQDHLVNEALVQNPSVRSFDVNIAVQKDLLERNQARYFPSLDFEASLNFADQLADNPPDFAEEHTTWSIWGGVRLPILLGADRIRERARLKAELSCVEFERDAAHLDVMGKVRSGACDLMARAAVTPRALRSSELAAQSLSLMTDEYEAGRRGLIDMLDAYHNARQSELAALTARYGFYLSLAQLVHDIGWPMTLGNTFREEFYRRVAEQFRN
ncbi:MAG: ABC transporter substrate binding protein [Candidatus Zixiibacteriota bacterium]